MIDSTHLPFRKNASWRVLDGFGRAVTAACRYTAPQSADELAATVAQARNEGIPITFRGAGRSYGDASLNAEGLIVDTSGMNRMLAWDPGTGIAETEPGLTIEGLWRRTIEDGFWPAVVPGTMRPTMAGCVAMNIHGKNNYYAGPFGEHVLELDLLTADGQKLLCSPTSNAEIFYAVIGGLGLLGAITRVKLQLKRVGSGYLRVEPVTAWDLDQLFDQFESRLSTSEYVVGWLDALATGRNLGRGILHAANVVPAEEDPDRGESLHVERQGLPSKIMGIPKSQLWKFMQFFMNNPGVAMVNAAKFHASRWEHGKTYLQSHVAFAFLLDYLPDWRLAYGQGGLIQHQIFIPHSQGRDCLRDVLELGQRQGMPTYLAVLKRHRPDPFLLTHALDGWSVAMDYRVTRENREALWNMTRRITDRVLAAGGKFYFAKDAVLRPIDVERAYGRDKLDRFLELRNRLDPEGVFSSDLAKRVLPLMSGTSRPRPTGLAENRAAEPLAESSSFSTATLERLTSASS